jgi:hypothetical protein
VAFCGGGGRHGRHGLLRDRSFHRSTLDDRRQTLKGRRLSITGSLATILWLGAIRREGENVTFGRFLKVGIIVMPPALLLALGARLLIR